MGVAETPPVAGTKKGALNKVLKDPVETERVIWNFDLWEKENNTSTDLNNNNNNNNKTFSRNSFF